MDGWCGLHIAYAPRARFASDRTFRTNNVIRERTWKSHLDLTPPSFLSPNAAALWVTRKAEVLPLLADERQEPRSTRRKSEDKETRGSRGSLHSLRLACYGTASSDMQTEEIQQEPVLGSSPSTPSKHDGPDAEHYFGQTRLGR